MPSTPCVRDIVETTIRNHPKDCIFAPNAVDNICKSLGLLDPHVDEEKFIEACIVALKENEIYCPHEGIDRRHLYPEELWKGGRI